MGVLSGEAADGHSPEQIVETATCADENRPTAVSSNEKKIFDSWRWTLVRIGIFSANFIYGLDTTIAAAIQAEAANDLGGLPQVGYLGAGFALGSAAAILPIGKAYGLFNMKWLFIGSLTMFAAGSALCGGAPSMVALIVGRVWAGVGGAGVYLGTLGLIFTLSDPKNTMFETGIMAFVYGSGCILGPVIGGLFASSSVLQMKKRKTPGAARRRDPEGPD